MAKSVARNSAKKARKPRSTARDAAQGFRRDAPKIPMFLYYVFVNAFAPIKGLLKKLLGR